MLCKLYKTKNAPKINQPVNNSSQQPSESQSVEFNPFTVLTTIANISDQYLKSTTLSQDIAREEVAPALDNRTAVTGTKSLLVARHELYQTLDSANNTFKVCTISQRLTTEEVATTLQPAVRIETQTSAYATNLNSNATLELPLKSESTSALLTYKQELTPSKELLTDD